MEQAGKDGENNMDVIPEGDATGVFLAGENKVDFGDEELLLSNVENECGDVEFKEDDALDCSGLVLEMLEECAEKDIELEVESVQSEKVVVPTFKRWKRNSVANALKKRSIKW